MLLLKTPEPGKIKNRWPENVRATLLRSKVYTALCRAAKKQKLTESRWSDAMRACHLKENCGGE